MKHFIVLLIRAYQAMPRMGIPHCRYTPTCSQDTREAVESYGAARGVWMGAKRILRCHPFHDGGYDPVPGKDSNCQCNRSLSN
jgi:putative membrane protein insertion efficiency factor